MGDQLITITIWKSCQLNVHHDFVVHLYPYLPNYFSDIHIKPKEESYFATLQDPDGYFTGPFLEIIFSSNCNDAKVSWTVWHVVDNADHSVFVFELIKCCMEGNLNPSVRPSKLIGPKDL